MATEALAFTELTDTDRDKFVTYNLNLRQLEATTVRIESRTPGSPPGSFSDGDAHIIDSGADTGVWASGSENDVTYYVGGTHYFVTPTEGMRIWVKDEDIEAVWDGSAWVNSAATATGVASMTDDSVPFVSGGVLIEDTSFTYDTATNSLAVDNVDVATQITATTYAGFGDEDTYIDFTTANTMAIYTGGSERARYNSSGDALIGTTSVFDSSLLTVAGDVGIENAGKFSSSGNGIVTIEADPGAAYASSYFSIEIDGSELARVNPTGFGIGTTNPSDKLMVVAGSDTNVATFRGGGTRQLRIGTTATTAYLNVDNATGGMAFHINTAERARIDTSGNFLIGGTTAGTSSAGNLHLFNGTAPTGSATNGVILYSEDVSSSAELKVRDEAGNITTLSPHNFSLIPDGPSEEMAWAYYSEKNGKKINADITRALRLLEKLAGEKLIYKEAA